MVKSTFTRCGEGVLPSTWHLWDYIWSTVFLDSPVEERYQHPGVSPEEASKMVTELDAQGVWKDTERDGPFSLEKIRPSDKMIQRKRSKIFCPELRTDGRRGKGQKWKPVNSGQTLATSVFTLRVVNMKTVWQKRVTRFLSLDLFKVWVVTALYLLI